MAASLETIQGVLGNFNPDNPRGATLQLSPPSIADQLLPPGELLPIAETFQNHLLQLEGLYRHQIRERDFSAHREPGNPQIPYAMDDVMHYLAGIPSGETQRVIAIFATRYAEDDETDLRAVGDVSRRLLQAASDIFPSTFGVLLRGRKDFPDDQEFVYKLVETHPTVTTDQELSLLQANLQDEILAGPQNPNFRKDSLLLHSRQQQYDVLERIHAFAKYLPERRPGKQTFAEVDRLIGTEIESDEQANSLIYDYTRSIVDAGLALKLPEEDKSIIFEDLLSRNKEEIESLVESAASRRNRARRAAYITSILAERSNQNVYPPLLCDATAFLVEEVQEVFNRLPKPNKGDARSYSRRATEFATDLVRQARQFLVTVGSELETLGKRESKDMSRQEMEKIIMSQFAIPVPPDLLVADSDIRALQKMLPKETLDELRAAKEKIRTIVINLAASPVEYDEQVRQFETEINTIRTYLKFPFLQQAFDTVVNYQINTARFANFVKPILVNLVHQSFAKEKETEDKRKQQAEQAFADRQKSARSRVESAQLERRQGVVISRIYARTRKIK